MKTLLGQKKMVRAYVTGKSVLNIILKGIPQS